MSEESGIKFSGNPVRKPTKVQLLLQIWNDPERKSMLRIFAELICLSFINRSFPPHYYMSRFLFKKFRKNIFDFYSDKFFWKVNRFFNEDGARGVLENKLFTHLFFSIFNIPMPLLLAHNHQRIFVLDGSILKVTDQEDFRRFLGLLAERITENDAVFIKKSWGSYGGENIFMLNKSQLISGFDDFIWLYNKITGSDYIFQERIKQHPVLDSLNPSCVNTIRIDTFIDRNGQADVMSAYLRIGLYGLYVDNISAGGWAIPIDIETGRLNRFGYKGPSDNWTALPEEHPETHKKFADIIIPYFNDVRKLVCRLALLTPELRLMGWDVAICEGGPVLIEGNTYYDRSGVDLTFGGYRKNKVFQKALDELRNDMK
jgi:hypothetical protein